MAFLLGTINGCDDEPPDYPLPPQDLPNTGTCRRSVSNLILKLSISPNLPNKIHCELLKLMLTYVIEHCFTHRDSAHKEVIEHNAKEIVTKSMMRWKCFIFLLLLLSGNTGPNPGPTPNHIGTPNKFRVRSDLGILHLKVQRLLPKLEVLSEI